MANYDLSKVMSLADAQAMYKDLRDRMKEIEVPVEDVMVDGVSVVVNGIANIPAIPTVPVTDVQIDGTSILNNGVANIPKIKSALPGGWGLVNIRQAGGYGLRIALNFTGQDQYALVISAAEPAFILNGEHEYKPIVPKYQHTAVYYGLSKLAGVDLKSVTATVGTYPDSSKQAIQKLFGLDGILGDYQNGITASKAYAVGDTFIMDGKRYRVTAAISDGGLITVGTNCELDPLDGHYVRDTDYATSSKAGLVQVQTWAGFDMNGSNLRIFRAQPADIKEGTHGYRPITPSYQHTSVFYALSKLAGVDLANETVTVGTYPATAKAAILAMLGAVGKTDIAGSTGESKGIAYFNGNYGVAINSETGGVYLSKPSDDVVKAGANDYKPIVPSIQHKSIFYGLSKLAGVDLANETVTVGTYPESSKTAIQTMLGVSTGAILIENVSGSTPTLTCLPNVRYKCGEVSTISITPPASGSCEVIFESGSTATLLTVPNTVKFPPWFDAAALETGMIYDIIITDGVYGAVMSWAS